MKIEIYHPHKQIVIGVFFARLCVNTRKNSFFEKLFFIDVITCCILVC